MTIRDRFTQGLLAGVIAGIITNIYSFISYYIGFSEIRYVDYTSIFIFGRKSQSLIELGFSLISQIAFCGFIGIIFTYLIAKLFHSNNHLLKGWFFGIMTWFIIYAVTILFNVPEVKIIGLDTAFSNFIAASIYGLSVSEALHRIDNNIEV